MNVRWTTVIPSVAFACGISMTVGAAAQQPQRDKPKVDLVTVVGCATRGADNIWMLISATEPKVIRAGATSRKEIEDVRAQALGKNRFRLIGTADFGSPEDLLKDPVRSQFTVRGSENATGQLQNGHKLMVKGLLINASDDRRINLTSVQTLADTCK